MQIHALVGSDRFWQYCQLPVWRKREQQKAQVRLILPSSASKAAHNYHQPDMPSAGSWKGIVWDVTDEAALLHPVPWSAREMQASVPN